MNKLVNVDLDSDDFVRCLRPYMSFGHICEAVEEMKSAFDGMTNGDVIKMVFPNVEFKKDHEFTVWGYINDGDCIVRYDIDWWNASYKGEENGIG